MKYNAMICVLCAMLLIGCVGCKARQPVIADPAESDTSATGTLEATGEPEQETAEATQAEEQLGVDETPVPETSNTGEEGKYGVVLGARPKPSTNDTGDQPTTEATEVTEATEAQQPSSDGSNEQFKDQETTETEPDPDNERKPIVVVGVRPKPTIADEQ